MRFFFLSSIHILLARASCQQIDDKLHLGTLSFKMLVAKKNILTEAKDVVTSWFRFCRIIYQKSNRYLK